MRSVYNHLSTLRREEWIQLDETVMSTARERLRDSVYRPLIQRMQNEGVLPRTERPPTIIEVVASARENVRGSAEFVQRTVAPGESVQPGDIIAEGPDGVYRTGLPRQLQVPHPTREELNRPMSLRAFAEEYANVEMTPEMEHMIDRILTPDSPQQAAVDYNWWGHSTVAMPNADLQGWRDLNTSEYEIITGDEQ